MKCTCKQCGKEFELTQSEIDFYNSKNLSIPKRCKECRNSNKKQKRQKAAAKKAAQNGASQNVKPQGNIQNNRVEAVTKPGGKKSGKAMQILKLVLALLIIGLVIYSAVKNSVDDAQVNGDLADGVETVATDTGYQESGNSFSSEIAELGEQSESLSSEEEESAATQESDVSVAEEESTAEDSLASAPELYFRNDSLLESHYEKHGIEMGFDSAKEYEKAAAAVTADPDVLHKLEAEDGDDVYYLERTNEFVVVSKDGHIRTYFHPSAGLDYYNRQ